MIAPTRRTAAEDELAALLYEAWCTEFNPDPSWSDEDATVHARWHNVADAFRLRAAVSSPPATAVAGGKGGAIGGTPAATVQDPGRSAAGLSAIDRIEAIIVDADNLTDRQLAEAIYDAEISSPPAGVIDRAAAAIMSEMGLCEDVVNHPVAAYRHAAEALAEAGLLVVSSPEREAVSADTIDRAADLIAQWTNMARAASGQEWGPWPAAAALAAEGLLKTPDPKGAAVIEAAKAVWRDMEIRGDGLSERGVLGRLFLAVAALAAVGVSDEQ